MLEELLRKREDFGDISSDMQILEAERARLSLLEEKIKEVLVMLRALNSTVREIRIQVISDSFANILSKKKSRAKNLFIFFCRTSPPRRLAALYWTLLNGVWIH